MKQQSARILLLSIFAFITIKVAAQNVGIGTTSPTQQLDVNGNLRVRGLGSTGAADRFIRTDSIGNLLAAASTSFPLPSQQSLFDPVLQGSVAAGGSPTSVAVSGNLVFVVNQTGNTLQVFDVSNSSAPVLQGTAVTGNAPFAVAVSGPMAYVVTNTGNTLQIFDCSNPAAPALRSSTATGNTPTSLTVDGTLAYVVNLNSNTLQLFDCANPAAPVLKATVSTGAGPRDVTVNGTTAYVVNSTENSLQVFDCSNPSSPQLQGTVTTANTPRGVAVNGPIAYVAASLVNTLQVFDCSNPLLPSLRSSVPTDSGPLQVAANGSMVYLVNATGHTLQMFDCSNPAGPLLRATVPTGTAPRNVALDKTRAYVVNATSNNLQMFRAFAPRLLGQDNDGSLIDLPANAILDNLGNHLATQNINLGSHQLVGSGGTKGIFMAGDGTLTNFGNINLGNFQLVGEGGTNGLSISNSGTVTTGGNINLANNQLVGGGGSAGISISGTGTVTTAGNINLGNNQLVGGGGSSGVSVTNAGNVGIGTANPNAPLQFANTALGRKIVLYEGADNENQYLGFGVNANVLRYQVATSNDNHVFYAGASDGHSPELMRITGTGNVGIGTNFPQVRLHVNGAVKINGNNTLEFGSGSAKNIDAGKIGYQVFTADALDIVGAGLTAAIRKIKFWSEGGAAFAGVVTASAFTVSSDARYKKDIRPVQQPLQAVQQLKGVSYFFDRQKFGANGFPGGLQYGFLAQEVENVLPDVVGTDDKGFKTVNYLQLIPLLTESIKVLSRQVESLQKKVDELSRQLER